jgi:hypothetical protein
MRRGQRIARDSRDETVLRGKLFEAGGTRKLEAARLLGLKLVARKR